VVGPSLTQLGYDVADAPIIAGGMSEFVHRTIAHAAGMFGRLAGVFGVGNRAPRRALVTMPRDHSTTVRTVANPNGSTVVLGTSDVADWDLRDLGIPTIINKGHGGDRTADLVARFDRDVIMEHPAMVILWGFENDLFDAPHLDYTEAMAAFEQSYTELIERSYKEGIEPILATEVTDGHRPGFRASLRRAFDYSLGRSVYEDRLNKQILDGNDWLREIARRESLLLLDLQPLLSDRFQYRLWQFAAPDGSHISRAGYAALTAYTRPLLIEHSTVIKARAHARSTRQSN
jgi:lysophospholipase L1-like esterase